MRQSSELGGSGSSAATSSPAPAMHRVASASTRAPSSTTRPRPTFTRWAEALIGHSMPQLAWSKGRPGAKRRLALLVGGALFLLLAYRDASVAKSSNVSVMAIVAVVVGT